MTTLLCSPTDRDLYDCLNTRILTISNLLPENYGADVLAFTSNGKLAVQRKAFPDDFLASKADGRLAREVSLLQHTECPVLILEGSPDWTSDGHLLQERVTQWTKTRFRNMFRTIRRIYNIDVEVSADIQETASIILEWVEWLGKNDHVSMMVRPKQIGSNSWGVSSEEDFSRFILQGFPGVGIRLATELYRTFNRIPLQWSYSKEELGKVPGIGKKRVDRLWSMLRGDESIPDEIMRRLIKNPRV